MFARLPPVDLGGYKLLYFAAPVASSDSIYSFCTFTAPTILQPKQVIVLPRDMGRCDGGVSGTVIGAREFPSVWPSAAASIACESPSKMTLFLPHAASASRCRRTKEQ